MQTRQRRSSQSHIFQRKYLDSRFYNSEKRTNKPMSAMIWSWRVIQAMRDMNENGTYVCKPRGSEQVQTHRLQGETGSSGTKGKGNSETVKPKHV